MSNDRKNRVFLSYASEDIDKVRQVYDGLVKRGLDVWFDKVDLKGGKWKRQIRKAIARSRHFVICISEAALKKADGDTPGFQGEELDYAYDIAGSQPESEFTIYPVRIEDCNRGDLLLSAWQQFNLFEDFENVLDKLAVNMGGFSLSDPAAKDERSTDEKLIDSLFAKAAAEYYAGKYNESITLFDAILALSTNDSRALKNKGITLSNLDRSKEAIEAYDKALEINPNDAGAWIIKGIALDSLSRYQEAVEACDKALKIDPTDANAWIIKGIAFDNLSRYQEAVEAYDNALEINPNEPGAWISKGDALWKLGQTEQALNAHDMALKIKPDDAYAWCKKGIILRDLSRNKEALAAFNTALELDPDIEDALNHQNELMKQLRNSD